MTLSFAQADARTFSILDDLRITEFEYHDSNYARPLVSHIVRCVSEVAPAGSRLLLVGANRLLIETLAALGYTLELWTFGAQNLPDAFLPLQRGRLEAEALKETTQLPEGDGYAAIVLPLVLEATFADLRPLLHALRERLLPDGALVIAATNLFKFGTRWRALLGKDFLPMKQQPTQLRLGGWHAVAARRFHSVQELTEYARRCGFELTDVAWSAGYQPFDAQRPMSLVEWGKARVQYTLRTLTPMLCDYLICSMKRTEGSA